MKSADVIGDVVIGESCFVGGGARVRGDYGRIRIGDRTSVQENVVVHARVDEECRVGSDVQLGHGSVLHNCTVKDYAVIGLGAVISDYAVVGEWAIVGEGAVVPAGFNAPDGKIAVGIPVKVVGDVKKEHKELWVKYKATYADLARNRYPKGLRKIV